MDYKAGMADVVVLTIEVRCKYCGADVDYLTGKADIAVIGTQSLRIMEKDGVYAVGDFIKGLEIF